MLPARGKLQKRLASSDRALSAPRSYDPKTHSLKP